MKTLIIIRHSKSSWGYENAADIDRPLKNRGIRNAYEMAKRILERDIIPEKIISSPAIRALHTATIFMRVLKIRFDNISIDERFYHASEEEIIQILKGTDSSINKLMIFGHNPTFTYLANVFSHEQIDNIPTSGVVTISFDTDDWKNISEKTRISETFDYPKKEYKS